MACSVRCWSLVLTALSTIQGVAAADEPPVTLTFAASGPARRGTFEVSGIPRGALEALAREPRRAREALRVFTVDDPRANASEGLDHPGLLGTHEVDLKARVLRFRTRFPTEPGVHYRAVFQPERGDMPVVATFTADKPAPSPPTTTVARVAPAASVLPENLLKFYVEFSAPMSRGSAYEHLKLLDAKGTPLDLPFLELGEELWDPRGVRFTLFFDPGRIKTGLRPREELGPVLEAGKSYTLVIDRGWHDAQGKPLKSVFRKNFRVGPPDSTLPDPKAWALKAPPAGSRSALVVKFPEPLDRGMLGRVLAVADRRGKPVAGTPSVGDDETSWSFVPDAPWAAGRHVLLVDKALEDLAGNSIGRPFEVDVFDRVAAKETGQTVELPFDVAGGQ